MIHDVDKTIEQLLKNEFGKTLPFDLSFAVPDKNFKPLSSDKCTLNCYLYDIRENRELRTVEPQLERHSDGTVAKLYPPARIKLSYCITAWSPAVQDNEPMLDEHNVLGEVLVRLLKYPILPQEALFGSLKDQDLKGQEPPLPATVALPEDMKSSRDFWNAVGGQLRPSLDYSITISVPYQQDSVGPMMTTARLRSGGDDQILLIGGTVRDSAEPSRGVPNAWVRVQQTGLTCVTDAAGHFQFAGLPPGEYTLVVRAVGFSEGGNKIQVPDPSGSYDVRLSKL